MSEHISHTTRYSDSSRYDLICTCCGATDARHDDRLWKPCPALTVKENQPLQSTREAAMTFVWTRERPTKPGHYWHRGVRDDQPRVVLVLDWGLNHLLCLYPGDAMRYSIPHEDEAGDHGEWSNIPIPTPTEAT